MARWVRTIVLKDVLDTFDEDKDPDEQAVIVGARMAERLDGDHDFGRLAESFRRVKGVGGFDKAMARLYDIADSRYIWVN